MMREAESPFVCHIFVCTHDREGAKRSCADFHSRRISKALKDSVNSRGWKGRVRVSRSGCLGLCAEGPVVMIYPQKIVFSEVSPDDVPVIIANVENLVNEKR